MHQLQIGQHFVIVFRNFSFEFCVQRERLDNKVATFSSFGEKLKAFDILVSHTSYKTIILFFRCKDLHAVGSFFCINIRWPLFERSNTFIKSIDKKVIRNNSCFLFSVFEFISDIYDRFQKQNGNWLMN